MNDWLALSLLVVLLVGNAFFVGAEFAIMSTRRSQIEPLADAGNKRAKTALYAIENVSLMLATCQLGITVCSLLILNVSEPALKHLMAGPLEAVGIPYQVVSILSFAVALIIVTYLHVIFGEMIPKNAAVSLAAQGVALLFAPPLVLLSRIFKPVIALLNWIADHTLKLMKIEPKAEVSSTFTLDELQNIVAQSTAEGTVADETGVLSGALEFSSKKVEEIMVPREAVVTLNFPCTPHDVERSCAQTGYSRFVLQDSADETFMGYIHVKDTLNFSGDRAEENIPWSRLRPLASLRPEMEIDEALAVMQRNQAHLSHVVSKTGQSLGVLFLEDILEQLVGEIKDTTQDHIRRREAAAHRVP
ncbi:hemolysin family protein [Rothia sp. ZJ1223]|uniref:hemolysin family protein n=1 Tax=Rothia sp. ZJ1223 TaxID=2811098 RepID=UPI00195906FF|nr:hemolysin family protein [Rothia sp. ZJ1223]MBM7051049.1 HlyC/CorC family transporter [Rothia sp. ZJ1223]